MYRRDGQQMPEPEEGAAFFQPMTFESEMGMVPPRPMGLQRGMLTGGFAEAQARVNAPRVMGLNPDLLTRGFPGAHGLGIANPASENCVAKGGTLSIVDTPQGQEGMCTLPDGTTCDEWALFHGECASTGSSYMDTVAAMNPWVVAGVAAALGFGGTYLWRKR
jgi:putative hemolysin